jgi:hypothetical protein
MEQQQPLHIIEGCFSHIVGQLELTVGVIEHGHRNAIQKGFTLFAQHRQ